MYAVRANAECNRVWANSVKNGESSAREGTLWVTLGPTPTLGYRHRQSRHVRTSRRADVHD